ncbi:MAG: HEAT repeat domain-containing protein [Thermoanaerobaculia bacterium]|nr:HEAT repeat domain-containing protein [Thermoanaerobaculia bacterium]
MFRSLCFLFVPAVLLAASPALPQTGSSLDQEVRRIGHQTAEWLVYSVSSESAGRFICCHTWSGGTLRPVTCRPEDDHGSWVVSGKRQTIGSRALLQVYLGVENGKVRRVQTYSAGCDVETSWPVHELHNVSQVESLALLRRLALETDRKQRPDRDEVLGALVEHRTEETVVVLGELTESSMEADLREKALFWLGQTRRPTAVELLSERLTDEPSGKLRQHILFCLSQTDRPEAAKRIRRAAEQDVSAEVREQGWFWLAQTGDPSAEDAIFRALRDEPDRRVREHAVFALSQLPGGRSVDALLRVLRTSDDRDVTRQALFWLAESRDPRALERISELLDS